MRSSLMSIAALGLASAVLAVPAPKHTGFRDIHKHHHKHNVTGVSWVHPMTAAPRGTGTYPDYYSPEGTGMPKNKHAYPSPSPTPTSPTPILPTPLLSRTPDTPSDKDTKEYLNLHNELRAKHHSPPLAYDAEIAAKALAYAKTCSMVHSNSGPENLCMGYDSYTSCINAWYKEGETYDYKNPTYDHFTQVVWKSAKRIGCGVATCDPSVHTWNTFIVCRYDTGNINSPEYFKANVLPE